MEKTFLFTRVCTAKVGDETIRWQGLSIRDIHELQNMGDDVPTLDHLKRFLVRLLDSEGKPFFSSKKDARLDQVDFMRALEIVEVMTSNETSIEHKKKSGRVTKTSERKSRSRKV